MFESWYADIGIKIKKWATWCFIIEAIGAIITGLVFFFGSLDITDADPWIGLAIIIFGPIVAFVSSWLLYGFGELIEKTDKNESNTAAILKILRESKTNNYTPKPNSNTQQAPKNEYTVVHKWRCDECGNMRTQSPCEYCGKE